MDTATLPPGTKKITLYNGCKIAYRDEGTGDETIVFIHGLGLFNGTWQKNIEGLKERYRCVALDLPGNGYSEAGDYPYTMDFFARCIIDFIGRLGLRHVTLAGHSMGGQIAMTASLMLPACCDRIILFAPAGFERFAAHERLMFKASMDYLSWFTSHEQAMQQLVRSSFYHMPQDARTLENALIRIAAQQPARHYKTMTDRCIAAMLAEPVADKLQLLSPPVLVLFGEQDALIPNTLLHPISTKKLAESAVKKLKKGTLHVLPRCGHFIQWECADKVNTIIHDWISRTTA